MTGEQVERTGLGFQVTQLEVERDLLRVALRNLLDTVERGDGFKVAERTADARGVLERES